MCDTVCGKGSPHCYHGPTPESPSPVLVPDVHPGPASAAGAGNKAPPCADTHAQVWDGSGTTAASPPIVMPRRHVVTRRRRRAICGTWHRHARTPAWQREGQGSRAARGVSGWRRGGVGRCRGRGVRGRRREGAVSRHSAGSALWHQQFDLGYISVGSRRFRQIWPRSRRDLGYVSPRNRWRSSAPRGTS